MPTGGAYPSPDRYGSGGEPGSGSSTSLLEHVTRALQRARGSLYSQAFPPTDPVGIECMAFARCIVFDGYGQNDRLSNAFRPATMQDPVLARWEKIFAIPGALATDPLPTRQARVAAAFARFTAGNAAQNVIDAMRAILGPAYVGVVTYNPSNAQSYWPGGTPNASTPWTSTIANVNIQASYQSPFYLISDGSPQGAPNSAWWGLVGYAKSVLDSMLPAWATFNVFCNDSAGAAAFKLDEHNVDIEILGS